VGVCVGVWVCVRRSAYREGACGHGKTRTGKCVLTMALFLLFVAASCIPFIFVMPSFIKDYLPLVLLNERLEAAPCRVLEHVVVASRINDEGDSIVIPGLIVNFEPCNDSMGLSSGRSMPRLAIADAFGHSLSDCPTGEGVALPDIERDHSWRKDQEAQSFWETYPVQAVATCYFDPQSQNSRIAMRAGVSQLFQRGSEYIALACVLWIPAFVLMIVAICVCFSRSIKRCLRYCPLFGHLVGVHPSIQGDPDMLLFEDDSADDYHPLQAHPCFITRLGQSCANAVLCSACAHVSRTNVSHG